MDERLSATETTDPIGRRGELLWEFAIWAGLCSFSPLLLHWEGYSLLGGDALASNLPLRYAAVRQWLQGRVPLWTADVGAGVPLWADGVSLPLDPRNGLYALLPPVWAYTLGLVLAKVLGGWATLSYLRLRHGLSMWPRLMAATVYHFGTVQLSEHSLHATGLTLDFFPLVVWASECWGSRGELKDALALTTVWVWLLAASSLAYAPFAAAFGAIWCVAQAWQAGQCFSAVVVRAAGYFLCIAGAWALLGVYTIPLAEVVLHSNRGGEYLADLFAARGLCFALLGPQRAGGYFPDHTWFFYIGLASWPFMWAARHRAKRTSQARLALWLAAPVLMVVIVLNTPVKSWLAQWVPLLQTVPAYRLAFLWGLVAALAVGHGAEHLRSGRCSGAIVCAAVLTGIQFVLVGGWLLAKLCREVYRYESPELCAPLSDLLRQALPGGFALLSSVRLATLTGTVAFLWWPARCKPSHIVFWLLAAEMVCTWHMLYRSKPYQAVYPLTPEVSYLRQHGSPDYRLAVLLTPQGVETATDLASDGVLALHADAPLVYGLATATIYHSLVPQRLSDYMEAFGDLAERRRRYPRAPNAIQMTSRWDAPLWDGLAVRYLLSRHELPDHPQLRLCLRGRSYFVYERVAALPRAYVVYAAQGLSRQALQERLRTWRVDFRRCLLLEVQTDQADRIPGAQAFFDDSVQPVMLPETTWRPASIVSDQGCRIVIHCQLDKPGWLVLADLDYPGWEAQVNGQPVPIGRAYGLARAVQLPAGDHTVVFVYRPATWYWGASLSALSWIAYGSIWTMWLWRRRRRMQACAHTAQAGFSEAA
ncbi:MAG: hypothetical protein C4297_05905 [Gemmataceae bacterium]